VPHKKKQPSIPHTKRRKERGKGKTEEITVTPRQKNGAGGVKKNRCASDDKKAGVLERLRDLTEVKRRNGLGERGHYRKGYCKISSITGKTREPRKEAATEREKRNQSAKNRLRGSAKKKRSRGVGLSGGQ